MLLKVSTHDKCNLKNEKTEVNLSSLPKDNTVFFFKLRRYACITFSDFNVTVTFINSKITLHMHVNILSLL